MGNFSEACRKKRCFEEEDLLRNFADFWETFAKDSEFCRIMDIVLEKFLEKNVANIMEHKFSVTKFRFGTTEKELSGVEMLTILLISS